MQDTKKVLIFTYYWPPAGGVAVQRFLKFSKFLPEFGWEPIIITVENGSYPYYDESLLKEISPSLRVYRTKTFEPFEFYNFIRGKKGKSLPLVSVGTQQKKTFFQRVTEYVRANFFIPDARKGWAPYAVKQAEEILKNEKIDAFITTGPPHSAHLIGLRLKQKTGIKWVADFRDPWTGIFYNNILPRTGATKEKDSRLETLVLQAADQVTVISPGMKKQFEARARKIEVIFNGFDEQDFSVPANNNKGPEVFTIRYVGNLMASQNVEVLWKIIKELNNQGKNIRLEFIGRVDETVKKSISFAGLDNEVSFKDFVTHEQAVALTCSASLLLFVIPDVEDNGLIITGKIFEYMASGSEILSIGPADGDAATILNMVKRKPMLSYTSGPQMKELIQAAYNHYLTTGAAFRYTDESYKSFSRKKQAAALAQILNDL